MTDYENIDPEMRDLFLLIYLRSEKPEDLSDEGKAKLEELENQFEVVEGLLGGSNV